MADDFYILMGLWPNASWSQMKFFKRISKSRIDTLILIELYWSAYFKGQQEGMKD